MSLREIMKDLGLYIIGSLPVFLYAMFFVLIG